MAGEARVTMDKLYRSAISQGASDIHIVVGCRPMLRVNGKLIALDTNPISESAGKGLFNDVAQGGHWETKLLEDGMVDFSSRFSFGDEQSRTFRVHAANENKGITLVLRLVPGEAPSMEKIGLTKAFTRLLTRPQGLVLVTGPTGSGKSTTLASIMNFISQQLGRAISTVEQPIEYDIQSVSASGVVSAVRQMEIPLHVASFANALRGILRQDPDVIMVGELRDYETMEVALHAAETGHLVFSTMHTNSAPDSIDRFVDVFPSDKQEQARTVLASSLLAILSQRLLPRSDGKGRVMAYELLLRHSSLPNLIKQRKTHQIADLVVTQQAAGMQAFDAHLASLVNDGIVDRKSALEIARNPNGLQSMLKGIQ